MGGKIYQCNHCSKRRYMYLSCGSSLCPICQGIKREQWQDRLNTMMLKVPYTHITFTMPHQLNGLAKRNPRIIYNILMRSAWTTINQLAAEKDNLGALPGMIAVLHTWGSDLKYHVHVHTLVTFGGLSEENKWKWPARKHKLAPFRKVCSTFRTIFLKLLETQFKQKSVKHHSNYKELYAELIKKRWVVHHTRPSADTSTIQQYLSRYVCRIAITDSRLTYSQGKSQVTILYNDYQSQIPGQPAPKLTKILHPLIAIDQFLCHVPPKNFQRVRYYGIHANSLKNKIQSQITDKVKQNCQTLRTLFQIINQMIKSNPMQCDTCKKSSFTIIVLAANRYWIPQNIRNYPQPISKNRAPPPKPMPFLVTYP